MEKQQKPADVSKAANKVTVEQFEHLTSTLEIYYEHFRNSYLHSSRTSLLLHVYFTMDICSSTNFCLVIVLVQDTCNSPQFNESTSSFLLLLQNVIMSVQYYKCLLSGVCNYRLESKLNYRYLKMWF